MKVSEEKLKKEIDSNLDLYSTIQMQMQMDALPDEDLLYGPDGVMFVKTRQTKTVAMMMHVYANSWENLEIDKLLSDQERKRTISGGSSHS